MADRIRTDGRTWLFVTCGIELPLPSPTELKRRAIEESYGEHAAMHAQVIELLEACTFDYEVVPGKDSITWLLGVVVYTDADHARVLQDFANSVCQATFLSPAQRQSKSPIMLGARSRSDDN
jgi:hypothetical protein